MLKGTEKILKTALRLDPAERAALTTQLVASFHEQADQRVEATRAGENGSAFAGLWLPSLLLLCIGIIFILLACIPMWGKAQGWEVLHSLVLELGLGFVVGFFISVTIEFYMRNRKRIEDQRALDEIKENIFLHLFRTALPPELVTEMYRALLVPKFVREDLQVKFTFRPLSEDQKKKVRDESMLIVQRVVAFRARNMTDMLVDHSVEPMETVLIDHPDAKSPFKEFLMKGSFDAIHLKTDEEIENAIKKHRDEMRSNKGNDYDQKVSEVWRSLGKQTVKVRSKDYAEVCLVTEEVCRCADTKTWNSKYAAKSLRLIVVVMDTHLHDKLEFTVDQSHRQELRLTDSSSDAKTWVLDYPVLPDQGIMVHWRPRKSEDLSAQKDDTRKEEPEKKAHELL